jgi:hypothetical protein
MKNHALRAALCFAASVALVSCDHIPTELPSWDITVRIPAVAEALTLSDALSEFMPTGVVVEGGEFDFAPVYVPSTDIPKADWCGSCAGADGDVIPFYPAFAFDSSYAAVSASEFASAQLSGGALTLTVSHTLPYDLLLSDAGNAGELIAELIDGTTVVASDEISGDDSPFPAGTPAFLTLDLVGITWKPEMRMRIRVKSYGSEGARTYDSAGHIRYAFAVTGVRSPAVMVSRDEMTVSGEALQFEIDEGLREDLLDPIGRAAAHLRVNSPFSLDGTMHVTFYGNNIDAAHRLNPIVPTQSFPIQKGESTATAEITAGQMRSLLEAQCPLGDIACDAGIYVTYSADFQASNALVVRAVDKIEYAASLEADVTLNQKK